MYYQSGNHEMFNCSCVRDIVRKFQSNPNADEMIALQKSNTGNIQCTKIDIDTRTGNQSNCQTIRINLGGHNS